MSVGTLCPTSRNVWIIIPPSIPNFAWFIQRVPILCNSGTLLIPCFKYFLWTSCEDGGAPYTYSCPITVSSLKTKNSMGSNNTGLSGWLEAISWFISVTLKDFSPLFLMLESLNARPQCMLSIYSNTELLPQPQILVINWNFQVLCYILRIGR